jgi:hypothetical protein
VILYVLLKTSVPPGAVRAVIAAAIVLAVLRWLPQSAAPLGFGGWIGSWLREGPSGDGLRDAVSGKR